MWGLTAAQGDTKTEAQTDQTVLDWGRGVEGAAGCPWGCWRAEDDGWNQSDERMTVEHTSPAEGLVVLQFDRGIGGLGDPGFVGALPIQAFVVHPGA